MTVTESGRYLEPDDAARQKAAFRAEMSARRDALPAEVRDAATRAIEARLVALPALEAARTVHCFVGIGSEVATEALIRGLLLRGHRVVAPRVKRRILEHVELTSIDTLVSNRMGLREPHPDAEPVPLSEVDVMLVPGLAFDAAGYRLGYGGGYYDRTLTELARHGRATTIGLAFEAQLVDEVPREEHDRSVPLIATETRTIVTGAP